MQEACHPEECGCLLPTLKPKSTMIFINNRAQRIPGSVHLSGKLGNFFAILTDKICLFLVS